VLHSESFFTVLVCHLCNGTG
jgi:Anaphase-promoting complex, cyclosome, subunit 3